MHTLNALVGKLDTYILQQQVLSPQVSASSAGWHTEHALLTINRIIEQIKKSTPANYTRSFKPLWIIVRFTNRLPRGRAQSPEVVMPKTFNEASLHQHLALTQTHIADLNKLSRHQYFTHPFFGDLKLPKAIRFMEIHTHHHLKIIEEILAEGR